MNKTTQHEPPPEPLRHKSSHKRSSRKGPSFGRRLRKSSVAVGDFLMRPVRKARAWWFHWGPGALLQKLFGSGADFVSSLMSYRGEDYSIPQKDGQILVRSWPSRATLLNPMWWFIWLGLFTWRWFLSRPYVPLVLALPAVLVGVGLLAASAAGSRISKGTEAAQYRKLLAVSMAAGDVPQARLAGDALVRLNPRSSEHMFRRAQVEEEAGNQELTRSMMADLANNGGSKNAALWMAYSVGDSQDFESWTSDQRKDYFRWLTVAIECAPSDPVPRRLLSDLQRGINDFRGAYATIVPVADADLDTTYITTLLEKQLGLTEKARSRAQKLERVFKDLIAENPQNVEARTRYAAILFLVERESDAVKVLEDGLVVATDPAQTQVLRSALTEAMVIEADRMIERDNSPLGLIKSLERLRQAMALDPKNPALLEAVTRACLRASESNDDELVVLREALVQGVAPDTAHFILGTIAINEGRVDEGQKHLEIAIKNNPNLPGLLNNLAHAISNGDEPDLERALRLADAAIRELPDHPYLRETRGQIYFKMGRLTEAIADLERALAAPELRPKIRESLAVAYEEIGQPEFAKRQRELLKRGK